MVSFNPRRLFSRPIFTYGLLALTTCIALIALANLPPWGNPNFPSRPEKEVLVRQFLSHASELAIRYQPNQTIPLVSMQTIE